MLSIFEDLLVPPPTNLPGSLGRPAGPLGSLSHWPSSGDISIFGNFIFALVRIILPQRKNKTLWICLVFSLSKLSRDETLLLFRVLYILLHYCHGNGCSLLLSCI